MSESHDYDAFNVHGRLTKLEGEAVALTTRMEHVEKNQAATARDVTALGATISSIKTDLQWIREALTEIRKNQPGKGQAPLPIKPDDGIGASDLRIFMYVTIGLVVVILILLGVDVAGVTLPGMR